jgi:hypothetical protein
MPQTWRQPRKLRKCWRQFLQKCDWNERKKKCCADNLEKRLEEVFQTISDSALAGEINAEEKLKKIAQMMEEYKQEIVELVGKITPTTPPEVRSEREQQATEQAYLLALEVKEITELYERTTQIWTSLAEDERIQKLEQREEKLNVAVQDLKQRQKTMAISLRLRVMQEMKNLQAEVKTIQEE